MEWWTILSAALAALLIRDLFLYLRELPGRRLARARSQELADASEASNKRLHEILRAAVEDDLDHETPAVRPAKPESQSAL